MTHHPHADLFHTLRALANRARFALHAREVELRDKLHEHGYCHTTKHPTLPGLVCMKCGKRHARSFLHAARTAHSPDSNIPKRPL